VDDLGGPEVRRADDLARAYLLARRRRWPVLSVPLPGAVGHAYRLGAHLAPEHRAGRRTWDAFLAARFAPEREMAR
jgi:hypothetical protein